MKIKNEEKTREEQEEQGRARYIYENVETVNFEIERD